MYLIDLIRSILDENPGNLSCYWFMPFLFDRSETVCIKFIKGYVLLVVPTGLACISSKNLFKVSDLPGEDDVTELLSDKFLLRSQLAVERGIRQQQKHKEVACQKSLRLVINQFF